MVYDRSCLLWSNLTDAVQLLIPSQGLPRLQYTAVSGLMGFTTYNSTYMLGTQALSSFWPSFEMNSLD